MEIDHQLSALPAVNVILKKGISVFIIEIKIIVKTALFCLDFFLFVVYFLNRFMIQ